MNTATDFKVSTEGEYNPIFDNARDYVERLLAAGLTTRANTIDPNTPI